MAYYENDDLNIWEAVHFPLPEEIREKLMTEEKVNALLASSEDVVSISVEKWQGVRDAVFFMSERFTPYRYYKNILEFINYKTCSLCVYSIRKYLQQYGQMQYNNDKCTICPLAAVDRCIDPDSTFNKIIKILEIGASYLESRNETITGTELRNNHKMLEEYVETMLHNIKQLH